LRVSAPARYSSYFFMSLTVSLFARCRGGTGAGRRLTPMLSWWTKSGCSRYRWLLPIFVLSIFKIGDSRPKVFWCVPFAIPLFFFKRAAGGGKFSLCKRWSLLQLKSLILNSFESCVRCCPARLLFSVFIFSCSAIACGTGSSYTLFDRSSLLRCFFWLSSYVLRSEVARFLRKSRLRISGESRLSIL
jgi:hypothetical protein